MVVRRFKVWSPNGLQGDVRLKRMCACSESRVRRECKVKHIIADESQGVANRLFFMDYPASQNEAVTLAGKINRGEMGVDLL